MTKDNIEEERIVIITDEKGKKQEGKIVFTTEVNGDDFVFYELKDGVYAAKVNEEGDLSPIEEDEWKLVEKIFNEFVEDTEEDE